MQNQNQNQNSSNGYLRPFLTSHEDNTVKVEEASLPNIIKDELLELNYVIREYSTRLPSLTTSNSNALIKRVSELVLLNISVNNLSSISNNNAQPKKGAELSKRNKELEETKYNIPDAMYMLGYMYEKGYGISMDISMAIYWYLI
ncbi:hypothetical protein LY90DRAFT_516714 [Neocallimastix californiae]|uniref:HCP-like protein n=1 Tax=Neocallimastix californiae TaxID=1754190 RepID=A0A1Y2ADA0_9FUNG|nr:hypothetical protein LY90DRAFT_516714 [Neocallimastix californiae]|eukprot:ORY20523.1 hypothetical protein LY90DRAFT_516714 [Neocallimastix californiae]